MGSGCHAKPRATAAKTGVMAVATSIALLASPGTAAAAESVTLPGPASVLTLGIVPGSNKDDLKGELCKSPNTCDAVKYSQLFYPSGADPLDDRLHTTPGLKIVYGYSQGGQVISAWMRKYAATEGAPSADEVVFVIIANGDRKYGGSNAKSGYVMPETQYKVIDISRQYDFGSDYPDHFNLLAMANAWAGFGSIHTDYEEVDIHDPNNIVWTEGNTTYVFVPTENIPLLDPLRKLGLTALADRLNGPLKEIIERAYDRSYLPAPAQPTALVANKQVDSAAPAGETVDTTVGSVAPAKRQGRDDSVQLVGGVEETGPAEPASGIETTTPVDEVESSDPVEEIDSTDVDEDATDLSDIDEAGDIDDVEESVESNEVGDSGDAEDNGASTDEGTAGPQKVADSAPSNGDTGNDGDD